MVLSEENKSQHILILAKELLDDIELSRLDSAPLLLKASRLARLTESEEVLKWLKYETIGYNGNDDLAIKYMGLTGRWTDYKGKRGYWGPLAQQEISQQTLHTQLDGTKIPSISYAPSSANPNEYVTGIGINKVKEVTDSLAVRSNQIGSQINQIGAIKSRVIGLIHEFVAAIYYEKLFSSLAESIFEKYRNVVDTSISKLNEEVLQKVPIIYDRLTHNDPEAISQGLNTCRRIIDGFADAIFPAKSEPVNIDGEKFELGQNNTKNRIIAYISERVSSKSRKKRLRQTLTNLYESVCVGVHSDVDVREAQALLLQTYMFLGEIAELPDKTISNNFTQTNI